jgi:Zn-dependent protease
VNPAGGMTAMVYQASTWVLPVVFAVTFHEAAHGFVAYQFGDDTAQRAGRVTFNPFKHVDMFGTIILPAMLILLRSPFLFGYAKPVPVNFRRLDRPRRDMVWVALAGPGTNVLLAIISTLLFSGIQLLPGGGNPLLRSLPLFFENGLDMIPPSPAAWLAANIAHSLLINAVLCVFNMLPLPPLDGGRVAVGLLPDALALPLARLERYGMLILLLFLFVIPYVGEQTGHNLNILAWLIGVPTEALIRLILAITGQGE